ncbi:MAG: succinylglutamate desuccinylase/aspartoacylase family protein [Chloroflexi bacterium]|nr:succinylglutamate desuccinylase/aspartoacylase family protein [Chloroflexota bacterium]
MPAPRKRKESFWESLAWILNIAGLGGIALVLVAYWALQPVLAAPHGQDDPQPINTASLPATFTPWPQLLFLPTITPNPMSTRIVVESPTPFVLDGRIHPIRIGYSVSGRPLEVYTFGNGPRQRMIVAGIHGGYEWNTIALADELMKYINENPSVIPEDVTLYVLRNLNPDGDARDHGIDGRVNDHGVDLNRNFPTNWSANWDRDGCWNYGPTTGGTGPGSEPETQALMGFLQTHKIEVLISYHSAALGVFPGGEPWEERSTEFAKQLGKVTGYPFPPMDTGCIFTGTLADYAVSLGSTAVDMELSTHKYTDLKENKKALDVLLDWDR